MQLKKKKVCQLCRFNPLISGEFKWRGLWVRRLTNGNFNPRRYFGWHWTKVLRKLRIEEDNLFVYEAELGCCDLAEVDMRREDGTV